MLRSVISVATKLADSAGYSIIPKWRLGSLEMAEHLRAVFGLYGIKTVFDVGANVGDYGSFLRKEVGFAGRIISVEPVGQFCKAAKARADADGNWTAHQMALGAEAGTLPINVTKTIGFSSFLTPDHKAVPEYADENVVERVEQVAVRRFDDFFAELGGIEALGPTFLKLDTQGFDLEVLKGGGTAIGQVAGLQSEVSLLPVYAGMPAWRDAITVYEAAGFGVSGMFAVNRDRHLQAVEFDCVLVRPAAATS